VIGHPYRGRQAVLATAHGKEFAIAPVMKDRLGIDIVVPQGLDTDSLGTFSGEIARTDSMEVTLERKARLGLAATQLGLGIASEGSYGPHPHIPFLAAGLEQMVLIDSQSGYRIQESLVDDRPVYESAELSAPEELEPILSRCRFPEHAVIIQPLGTASHSRIFKGIRSRPELEAALTACLNASPVRRAQIQSDMRAHMNPTRMATIARLAERLADRLLALCSACNAPGFGRIGVVRGLPCSGCGWPTEFVREEKFGCHACSATEIRPRSDGLVATDPRNCPNCNP